MKNIEAYIGLGSNLENPAHQIKTAIEELDQKQHTQVLAVSSFYQSPPMGPSDQPDYINAAVKIQTWLSPFQLLELTQSIERSHGRVPTETWGPRVIDLDILLYGRLSLHTDSLIIPHVGIKNRDFVLKPLLDLEPQLQLPCGSKVELLFSTLRNVNLTKIDDEQLSGR